MRKETIVSVPDIVCDGCANSIQNALGKIEGIEQIRVDVSAKTVAVEHDDARISRARIEAVLDDIGFPVG